MKTLLPVFLLFFCSNIFANSQRNLEYWCSPTIRMEGLEAVLVTKIAGQSYLEVYTESESRWGSVDVKIEPAALTINNEFHQFISENTKINLAIDTQGVTPNISMSFFEARFIDHELGFNDRMICEYRP